jgi:hypothetical protein
MLCTVGNDLSRTPLETQILAKVMFDRGETFKVVQNALGGTISMSTLTCIKQNNEYSQVMLEEFKRRLPFKAYKLADNVLDLIDLEEVKRAPLNIKMMTFGIAIDKARDMEGSNRPVFNIVSIISDCKKTRDRLEAQLDVISQRKRQLLSSTAVALDSALDSAVASSVDSTAVAEDSGESLDA